MMNMLVYKKDYFKATSEVQQGIKTAICNLYNKIESYEKNNHISFDKIFNDDHVKYDQYGKYFFAVKYKVRTMQFRILYTYLIIEGSPVIVVVDYVLKQRNTKEYIKKFETIKNADPYQIYAKSKLVMTI